MLADCPFDLLRSLNAGLDQQIPTLEEALELIDNRVGINVELKTAGGTGEAVATLLRRYIAAGLPTERLLVSSFHLPELWEFKQLAPEIPVAPLLCGVPLDWAGCAVELGAAALNISAEFAEPRLIADAKSHGMKVYAYTVNDPVEMRLLQQRGVDGIFTDYPDRALALGATD
jgi:glycerophosphoryl diester phosphodiesterase